MGCDTFFDEKYVGGFLCRLSKAHGRNGTDRGYPNALRNPRDWKYCVFVARFASTLSGFLAQDDTPVGKGDSVP
jgi:hypothetical protein